MHGDMTCRGIALELIKYSEPGMARQIHIQKYRVWMIGERGCQAVVGGMGDYALETQFVRQIALDFREADVVFHHQQQTRTRLQPFTIVFDLAGREWLF